MKKSGIIMGILIIILSAYSVLSTVAMVQRTNEYDKITKAYNELLVENLYEDNDYSLITLEASAHCIDEGAKITRVDNVVYMYVPCTTNIMDVKSNVEKFLFSIPPVLEKNELDSCVITVIDANGKCLGGWTVLKNGDTNAFLGK